MLCRALGQNVLCFFLIDKLGGGCSSLQLGLVRYGVMVRPHGLLNLLEVRTLLVPSEERGPFKNLFT